MEERHKRCYPLHALKVRVRERSAFRLIQKAALLAYNYHRGDFTTVILLASFRKGLQT
jgi:hypothetical protein